MGRERARGPDDGDGEGRRRRAFGRGRRKRARGSAVGIFPSPASTTVVEWADRARGDDGGVATHADCADGERVGAARVRTSEADLASLWGRDMTVTRAVPDIQNTEKDTGKESTGANVRGALASVGATARVREGPGRRGFRVDGTSSPVARRREDLSRIRAGDGWVHRPARLGEVCSLGTAETTSSRTNNRHPAVIQSSRTQRKSRCPRRATDSRRRGHTSRRRRWTSRRGRRHAEGCRRRGGRPSRGGRSGVARGHGKPQGGRRVCGAIHRPVLPRTRARVLLLREPVQQASRLQVQLQAVLLRRPAGAFMGPPGLTPLVLVSRRDPASARRRPDRPPSR